MNGNGKDNCDPFNTERPIVYTLGFWQRIFFYPAAALVVLYMRTWRFSLDAESREILKKTPGPRMLVTWHNRSLVTAEFIRRHLQPERMAALVSPSKMAAWEVALFELLGMQVTRGSTTRRSIQGAREMLRHLKNGNDVGISPDGPSGPLYSFQEGATALAHKAGVPLLMIASRCRHAKRLRTWDRHMLPWPFAGVTFRLKGFPQTDPVWQLPIEEATERIRQECLVMTDDPF